MSVLRKLNLQYFSGGDFDLDSFRSNFEETYEEPEDDNEDPEGTEPPEDDPEGTEPPEDDDPEGDEDPEDDNPEGDDDPEDLEDTGDEDPLDRSKIPEFQKDKPKQSKEENAAFAAMRKRAEAAEAQAEAAKTQSQLLAQVAAQYNMSPEQFATAYQEQMEKEQAEAQGVPVEVLRRLEQQEKELSQLRGSGEKERFWNRVDAVKAKYGLATDEIENVFHYIGSRGLVNPQTQLPVLDFEEAYKAANFDKIMERKVKESKQKQLADKKQRQQKSAKPHGNASATPSKVDDMEAEFEERLKRLRESNAF